MRQCSVLGIPPPLPPMVWCHRLLVGADHCIRKLNSIAPHHRGGGGHHREWVGTMRLAANDYETIVFVSSIALRQTTGGGRKTPGYVGTIRFTAKQYETNVFCVLYIYIYKKNEQRKQQKMNTQNSVNQENNF